MNLRKYLGAKEEEDTIECLLRSNPKGLGVETNPPQEARLSVIPDSINGDNGNKWR